MTKTAENIQFWNQEYDWLQAGDEWSAEFGGTEALWFFVLYPRIHRFLPTGRILEIAPGYGRWTQFLKDGCRSLVGVDIAEKCISACKERFAAYPQLEFHQNDGTSLDMVADDSIDFVFSFDSLVHVEKEVMEAYVGQLARKLASDGVGFIHYSNMAVYPRRIAARDFCNRTYYALFRKMASPARMTEFLSLNFDAGRGETMSAALFREYCRRADLKCIGQENLNWLKGKGLGDTFSVFTRPNSKWDREEVTLENPEFAASAQAAAKLSKLYCR